MSTTASKTLSTNATIAEQIAGAAGGAGIPRNAPVTPPRVPLSRGPRHPALRWPRLPKEVQLHVQSENRTAGFEDDSNTPATLAPKASTAQDSARARARLAARICGTLPSFRCQEPSSRSPQGRSKPVFVRNALFRFVSRLPPELCHSRHLSHITRIPRSSVSRCGCDS